MTKKSSINCALALPLVCCFINFQPQQVMAAKSTTKPATKPAAKLPAKPSAKPVAKPAEKQAAKPAAKATMSSTAYKEQLDAIQKKLEKDEIGNDVYAELEKIIEADPTNYRAHLYLGNCYDKLGLLENAAEEFKLATKYGPSAPKGFVELVKQQVRLGQMPAAMELLRDAQKKFPNDPEIMFWAGTYLVSQSKWPEAERVLTTALNMGKPILGLPSALAEIKMVQGDFVRAKELAQKDLAIKPTDAMANRIYGLCLASIGNFEESIKPLSIAYEQQPFKNGLAENLSACALWAGQYHVALEPSIIALGATASLDSNNQREKTRLYDVFRHVSHKDIERAVESATIKIGKHPPGAYFFALGDVLDGIKMHKLAIAQYQRGLQEEPTFGRGWFRLGKDFEVYARNYDQAMLCYQKAHAFKPEDQEIALHMYSLSDKLAKRDKDWSWKLKDVLKPPKKIENIGESKPTSKASSER